MLQILAVALQFVDYFQHAARIAIHQRLGHLLERFQGERTKQRTHLRGIQLGAAAGDGLIESREGIAHAALPGLRQHRQSFGIGGDALLLTDPGHARHQVFEIHGAEAEVLAPGRDSCRDFVRFGGAEDEDDPLGRFFDGLQERIEGVGGDLVGFVDDEDLVAGAGRALPYTLIQLPHLIDAAVGGGVDLDDVHAPAARGLQAVGADAARLGGRPIDAVDAAGQDARDGGLTGAALSRKDVPVGDAALRNGVFKRGLDVFLVEHVVKGLRPVLSRDDLVHAEG